MRDDRRVLESTGAYDHQVDTAAQERIRAAHLYSGHYLLYKETDTTVSGDGGEAFESSPTPPDSLFVLSFFFLSDHKEAPGRRRGAAGDVGGGEERHRRRGWG